MRLEIRGRRMLESTADAAYVERRLRCELTRFGDRVERVTISMRDGDGSQDGVQKRCRIVALLRPSVQVVTEGIGLDARGAIDQGADRLRRLLVRVIERVRETEGRGTARRALRASARRGLAGRAVRRFALGPSGRTRW